MHWSAGSDLRRLRRRLGCFRPRSRYGHLLSPPGGPGIRREGGIPASGTLGIGPRPGGGSLPRMCSRSCWMDRQVRKGRRIPDRTASALPEKLRASVESNPNFSSAASVIPSPSESVKSPDRCLVKSLGAVGLSVSSGRFAWKHRIGERAGVSSSDPVSARLQGGEIDGG